MITGDAGGRVLAGQSGRPQRQPSRSAPVASAPRASARRWLRVRGSWAHTVGQRLQAGIDCVGIGADQPAEDLGYPVAAIPDRQFPIRAPVAPFRAASSPGWS
jgi:hypothetical protein